MAPCGLHRKRRVGWARGELWIAEEAGCRWAMGTLGFRLGYLLHYSGRESARHHSLARNMFRLRGNMSKT